jgi:HK97 family phage prohead protease
MDARINQITREMEELTKRQSLRLALGEVKQIVQRRMEIRRRAETREGQQMLHAQQFRAYIRGDPDWKAYSDAEQKMIAAPVRYTKAAAVLSSAYEVRAGEQLIAGYLSTYGNVDQGGDICERGCFDLSIANSTAMQARTGQRFLLPLLWNHNSDKPCGGIIAADTSDPTGLFITALIDIDTSVGQLASSAVAKGYGIGLSIGYLTKKSSFDSQGVRHITQAELIEGSLTPLPMNQLATVTRVE